MRVAVAFDHRGVKLRERILETVQGAGHDLVDLGTDASEPKIDYPDKAREIGDAVRSGGADRGVLVCGSGVGASVAAHQGVEHDDMNVLCLGSEVVGAELAADLVRAFLRAEFDGGERYVRRLEKINEMERRNVEDTAATAR